MYFIIIFFQMLSIHKQAFMRGFRNGAQLWKGFLADEGRKDLNTNKSGPSLASQQNAISMAIKSLSILAKSCFNALLIVKLSMTLTVMIINQSPIN